MILTLPYLTSVLELPPLVAQAAFDDRRRAHRQAGPLWNIAVPGGSLELRGDGRVGPPPRPCFWSYREARGWILTRRQPPIPVRLELVPWSSTRSALGLATAGPSLGSSEVAWFDVGGVALSSLADEMHRWAWRELEKVQTPLRRAG